MASPVGSVQDSDTIFRLIDETLLEADMAEQGITEIVEVCPYLVETSIPGVHLPEEDDSFYAGRPLTDAETNNDSDILAIGDSMFHKFYGRPRQEASKVSSGGGRIPEIKIYLQESGRRKRKIVILCMGHNDILIRKKRDKTISLEHIFKLYVPFIDWLSARCDPDVIFLCTLVPVKMGSWFNAEAEQLNEFFHAYGRHNKNVIVLDVYCKLTNEIQGNWEDYYDSKLLNNEPLMNDLINLAVDFHVQDKQEILTSNRLITTQAEDNYFRNTNIWGYHNICRRNFQKLMKKDLSGTVAICQQISIEESRQTDEPLPDIWHKGMTNIPPYQADYEANNQKQPGAITKEDSRIAFWAQLLQERIVRNNARLKRSGPVISPARARIWFIIR